MAKFDQHPKQALQDLLDERIDPRDRAEVQAHVDACEECREELASLRWLKRSVLEPLSEEPLPESLHDDIRKALDLEDAARGTAPASWLAGLRRPLAYAVPVILVAALLL